MSLILPNSIFIHTPKTGGSWVSSVLAGWAVERLPKHIKCEDITDERPKFTFVRNPLTWYQSRWSSPSHRERISLGRRWGFDATPEEEGNFQLWVERVTSEFPGHLYRLYRSRTVCCDFVGKFEQLKTDLMLALKKYNEDLDPQKIENVPLNECDAKWLPLRRHTPTTIKLIQKSEARAFEEYGYNSDSNPIISKPTRLML